MKGVIKSWNEERGFGFIRTENGKGEVFAHISAFSHKKPPPQVGESVVFDVHSNQKNKPEARNIRYTDRVPPQPRQSRKYRNNDDGRNHSNPIRLIVTGMAILLILGVVWRTALREQPQQEQAVPSPHLSRPVSNQPPAAARFRCDGRQYCSQMTSCEEAKFFLNHCPNTQMDGNHDGVPCESQWCGQ